MDLISAIKKIIASNGKSIVESDTFISFLYDYNAFSEESHRAVPKIFKILCHDSKVQKIITEDKSGDILSFKIKTIISDITDEYGFEKDKVADALKKLLIGCEVISDAEEWDVILSEPQLIEEQEEANLQVTPPLPLYNESGGYQVTPELAKAVQKYDELGSFHEELAAVRKGDLWGFISKNGEEVIPCVYNQAGYFSEGLVAVQKGDLWGFVNQNGEKVVSFRYDETHCFFYGLAAVRKGGLWGFISKNGKEVIPCIYDDAGYFSDGLARVKKSGSWGFIDKHGEKVIAFRYVDASSFSKVYDGTFIRGLAAVKDERWDRWGFIAARTGKKVIPFRYDGARSFSEELAAVKENRLWGFINCNGEVVIPFRYKKALSFSEGMSAVKKGDLWGFVNKDGEEVIPCEYDYALSFSEELAAVKFAGKWAYVKNGNSTFYHKKTFPLCRIWHKCRVFLCKRN